MTPSRTARVVEDPVGSVLRPAGAELKTWVSRATGSTTVSPRQIWNAAWSRTQCFYVANAEPMLRPTANSIFTRIRLRTLRSKSRSRVSSGPHGDLRRPWASPRSGASTANAFHVYDLRSDGRVHSGPSGV